MLDIYTLTQINRRNRRRFIYTEDIKQFNKREHWVRFDEIPDHGTFKGDCEDYTQAIRKELASMGEKSRIAICGYKSDTANHAVCLYGDKYIFDYNFDVPKLRSQLNNYKFLYVSGFEPGDPWRKVL